MSLLEAPCAKTSWRALLFRAILGITGALIVCLDIWRFKQVNNSETGFGVHHCDFEQHVTCLTVHMCMNSVKFVLEAPGASILLGATIPWQCADSLGGASVREGASNRDITVRFFSQEKAFGLPSAKWISFCPGLKSLWPRDIIWRHRYGSTLGQVITCRLMASSHYLNQY